MHLQWSTALPAGFVSRKQAANNFNERYALGTGDDRADIFYT